MLFGTCRQSHGSHTCESNQPAAKKDICGDVIICACVHVQCTQVSQCDVSYVGRCHSSRVAPFIGTSSPAVDTLLRCHVQPFCEPVALHNSPAAWKICPHKGTIIVHRREVTLSERCPFLDSQTKVSNQCMQEQQVWRQKWSLFLHRRTATFDYFWCQTV